MNKIIHAILLAILSLLIFSCNKENKENSGPGSISLSFEERVNGELLQTDTFMYVNEAGNPYLISEVQYFISKFTIFFQGGVSHTVNDNMGIHYIDSDIPGTRSWDIPEEIPSGHVDSITLIFGLDEATNQSNIFPNPPESNMFWPDQLGGGYHYMKLNGKWKDPEGLSSPFNFHLGIGQTYDTTGQVTGFVQNYFKVTFAFGPLSSAWVEIKPDQTYDFLIVMNIESWFSTPVTWDFNTWGGMIMQNQEAMHAACTNGLDVFTLSYPLHSRE